MPKVRRLALKELLVSYLEQKDALWQAISSIAHDEDLLLYDVEKMGPAGLRVTIDKHSEEPRGEQPREGVRSEDCTKLCRRLMVYFAVEGPNFGLSLEPQIEVASPGVNRELRLPEHFLGALGERVKVVPNAAQASEGPVVGLLQSFDDDGVKVIDEKTNEERVMPLSNIKRARVDFQF